MLTGLTGPKLPGQVRSGQVRSGQVRPGQVRSAQLGSREVSLGQEVRTVRSFRSVTPVQDKGGSGYGTDMHLWTDIC